MLPKAEVLRETQEPLKSPTTLSGSNLSGGKTSNRPSRCFIRYFSSIATFAPPRTGSILSNPNPYNPPRTLGDHIHFVTFLSICFIVAHWTLLIGKCKTCLGTFSQATIQLLNSTESLLFVYLCTSHFHIPLTLFQRSYTFSNILLTICSLCSSRFKHQGLQPLIPQYGISTKLIYRFRVNWTATLGEKDSLHSDLKWQFEHSTLWNIWIIEKTYLKYNSFSWP